MPRLATHISGPVIVIGDLHGQADQFTRLLCRLQALPDFDQRWIVLLGDLVDRGPDPKRVVDAVIDLIDSHPRTTIVCGNHELEMSRALGWIPVRCKLETGFRWLHGYGAETTFASYGAPPGDLKEFQTRIPTSHRELMTGLPWCVEHPLYVFVHAGLDPNLPCALQLQILHQRAQTRGSISWLSSNRLVHADPPRDCRRCVVSGHILVPEVVSKKRRLLVGTSDGVRGRLTAVLLPERRVMNADAGWPEGFVENTV